MLLLIVPPGDSGAIAFPAIPGAPGGIVGTGADSQVRHSIASRRSSGGHFPQLVNWKVLRSEMGLVCRSVRRSSSKRGRACRAPRIASISVMMCSAVLEPERADVHTQNAARVSRCRWLGRASLRCVCLPESAGNGMAERSCEKCLFMPTQADSSTGMQGREWIRLVSSIDAPISTINHDRE